MPELLISTRESALADILEAPTSILDGITVRRARPRSLPRILEDPEAVDALVMEMVLEPRDADFVIPQVRQMRPKMPLVAIFDADAGSDAKRLKSEFQLHSTLTLPLDPFALLQRLARLIRAS